jgi:gluconate 2-dehydrogenase
MPKLRAASTISVGYDTFDVDALNAKNILLMHTSPTA